MVSSTILNGNPPSPKKKHHLFLLLTPYLNYDRKPAFPTAHLLLRRYSLPPYLGGWHHRILTNGFYSLHRCRPLRFRPIPVILYPVAQWPVVWGRVRPVRFDRARWQLHPASYQVEETGSSGAEHFGDLWLSGIRLGV